jgi:formate dehydrogenase major subunit
MSSLAIRKEHGANAIGVVVSPKTANKDGYLMRKFARAVLRTNNIDNCSRYCQSPATEGLLRTVGLADDTGSIEDIGKSAPALIVGSNTTESHPALAARVKRAHKLYGQRLIVADVGKHEMAERADIFFRPKPGTDLVWLSAMSRCMLEHAYATQQFLDQCVNGLEAYRKSLESFTMEFVAATCQVPLETPTRVAEEIAKAETMCVLWAMGITQHSMGSDSSAAISNLLLITGNYRKPGCGAYPLRGHNNVQGTCDIGAMPHDFPG